MVNGKNMIWIKNSIVKFFTNPRCVFFLGLAIALLATSLEVFRGRCTNYYDYYDATMMFWSGISPYTQEFYGTHCLYFLYSPVYTTVYAPVFLLPWWLGPFVWNIGNYCLFCLAIKMLPEPLAPHRMKIFLFLLSLLLQGIFCYQYNIVVCYIFLYAVGHDEGVRSHRTGLTFLLSEDVAEFRLCPTLRRVLHLPALHQPGF